jgi:hypothetical protein
MNCSCPAVEELEPCHLLWCELVLAGQERVEFRGEGANLHGRKGVRSALTDRDRSCYVPLGPLRHTGHLGCALGNRDEFLRRR